MSSIYNDEINERLNKLNKIDFFENNLKVDCINKELFENKKSFYYLYYGNIY